MKRFLYLIIFLACSSPVLASHIVGGEMIYQYLGPGVLANSKHYKITLKLFRDQNSTGAAMPTDVFIGIFSGMKQYPGADKPYDPKKIREDNVVVNPFPPCVVNPDPISYHAGIYELTLDLPDNPNGYTASYQTCCRVNPLENVGNSNPVGTGSTYSCYIPPEIDNSPQFSSNVSLVCRSRNFTLDFSATDPDADSLVYSFCNAYDGGQALDASNINPLPPPYKSVVYANHFSAVSPLGRFVTINTKTGIISGVAPDVGKYVVCVCVSSYKNGVFVAEHRKDFIVKIGDCDFAGAQLLPRPVSCGGFNVSFYNDNNSPQNLTYFWDFGVPSLTNDTSNLPNPTFIYPDTGVYVYKLVINRNQPCGDSALQTIKVYPGFFPGFSWAGRCINTPIQFTDTTKSRYGVVNSWSWDFGDPFTLADTSHDRKPVYTFSNSGSPIVTFVVSNSKGCSDTLRVPVPIIDAPVLTGTFKDTTYCGKDTIQLHVTSNVSGTFNWTPNIKILNANTADPFVFPASFTSYVVKLDAGGCSGTDTINVNPKSDLIASINATPQAVCEDDPVTLSAVTNYVPVKYLWSPAATLTSDTTQTTKASPTVPTTYTLLTRWGKNCAASANTTIAVKKLAVPYAGPDTAFCAGSAGVTLHASGGDDYIWTPSSGLSDANVPDPVANPAVTTSYIVSAGVTGCIKRREDTVLVLRRNLPRVTLTNDTLICYLDTIQLSAAATAATKFSWSPAYMISNPNIPNPLVSPDLSTRYYIRVTDSYKCSNTDSVFIDVKQSVTVQSGNDTTICQTDVVQLKTTGDALHYAWSPASALDNAATISPFATPLATTTFHVTANIGKCVSGDNIKITVVPYPKANAGNDTAVCFNSSVTLHATGGNKYLWTPATYLSDPNTPDPVSVPDQSIQYIVTVSDNKGCPKPVNDSVFVKIFPKIIANAGMDTTVVINQPLQLHGSGSDIYLWSPATGLNNAHIADPVAVLKDNQQYILKTSNAIGCSSTDTINIVVYKVSPGLYTPNAFTPNGDNLNDIFRPVPLGMKYIVYFKIFNRFGQLLFSTSQPNVGWDGSYRGKLQNADIYVWIAEGIDYTNKTVLTKGTVMLVR